VLKLPQFIKIARLFHHWDRIFAIRVPMHKIFHKMQDGFQPVWRFSARCGQL
jgi:hypothetical protein